VAPRAIVEHFDVIKQIGLRLGPRATAPLTDSFFLQAAEEGLGNGVVTTVPAATHAGLQMMRPAEALEVVTPVLRPLIRMNDESRVRPTAPHSYHDRVEHEPSRQRRPPQAATSRSTGMAGARTFTDKLGGESAMVSHATTRLELRTREPSPRATQRCPLRGPLSVLERDCVADSAHPHRSVRTISNRLAEPLHASASVSYTHLRAHET